MSSIELFLIAVSLALDAAVVSASASMARSFTVRKALLLAVIFGAFQGVMPLFGWLGGFVFQGPLLAYGNVIGFVLILLVGLKMLKESFDSEEEKEARDIFQVWTLLALAFATSIDALVVGITFNFLPVSIPVATTTIGVVTFFLCLIASYVGKRSRGLLGNRIELIGAVALILLAFKILLF